MNEDKKIFIDLEKVPLKTEREEKKNKKKRVLLTIFLCLVFLLVGIFGTIFAINKIFPRSNSNLNVVNEVEYVMDNYWLYGKDYEDLNKEMENKALYGMTHFEDDPYTTYMSRQEQESFYSTINMNYVGIGLEYTNYDNVALVKKVFNDSPAEKAGILAGDIMKKIDGKSIDGYTTDEIKAAVIGEEGSKVVITVYRGGELIDITCTRAPVNNTVYGYKEEDYLVLEISSFGESTNSECINFLDKHTDCNSIIIDLRNNSGGLQSSVEQVCGLFIGNNKPYLIQEDVGGNRLTANTKASKTYDNLSKIIILTNESTASAAEVCAICLKEQHPNVTLVGTKTYGKGVIQSQKILSNGGSLKFTTFYWYSPSGASINKEGITPDVEVKMDDIYYEFYYAMNDDDSYEYDSVSEYVRISELALKTLGYDVDRTDGYFDESFYNALNAFKVNKQLDDNSILDKQAYQAIISEVSRLLLTDPSRDLQMLKAKELIK